MKRKPSLLVVFLTVFIDLIGFGIVVPLVPIYSRHYGAGWLIIGTIVASYSAMQFLFAPVLGRLVRPHWPPSGHAHQHRRRGAVLRFVCHRVGF